MDHARHLLLVFCALLAVPAIAQEQPTLDLSVNHGPILHNGNGFHGGFNENVDPDRIIDIKPSIVRRYGGQTLSIVPQTGTEVVALLPNYSEGQAWQTNWSAWTSKVNGRINDMKNAARDHGISYHYDIWNEPDNWQVPDYNEFWCRTAEYIRSQDPGARIAGPSYSYAGQLQEFVTYAANYSQENNVNVMPSIVNWHEFSDPMRIISDAAGIRQWLADNGYDDDVTQLSVNEFMMSPMPDVIPRMFAATEISDIDWAGCGYGSRGPSELNGLVKEDGSTPNGAWNSYKFYADMTGEVVGVAHSENVNIFATVDTDKQQLLALLGTDKNREDDVEVVLNNMSASGIFGESGRVLIATERYKIWGGTDNQYEVEVDYTNDTLVIPLSGLVDGKDLLPGSDKHGLSLTITPVEVPEPASLCMLAAGGLGLLARRRRR
jgi:hypothetical protein